MIQTRQDGQHLQELRGGIPDDEPVFLLRGSDVAAPDAIREWARVNCALGGDPRASRFALGVADAMEAWQDTHEGRLSETSV